MNRGHVDDNEAGAPVSGMGRMDPCFDSGRVNGLLGWLGAMMSCRRGQHCNVMSVVMVVVGTDLAMKPRRCSLESGYN